MGHVSGQHLEDGIGIIRKPAPPRASTGRPFLSTMVGHMLVKGRLPEPSELGWPGRRARRVRLGIDLSRHARHGDGLLPSLTLFTFDGVHFVKSLPPLDRWNTRP
jgi:hypothetical protein